MMLFPAVATIASDASVAPSPPSVCDASPSSCGRCLPPTPSVGCILSSYCLSILSRLVISWWNSLSRRSAERKSDAAVASEAPVPGTGSPSKLNLHTGHVLPIRSHSSKHSLWKTWLHSVTTFTSSSSKSFMQMQHSVGYVSRKSWVLIVLISSMKPGGAPARLRRRSVVSSGAATSGAGPAAPVRVRPAPKSKAVSTPKGWLPPWSPPMTQRATAQKGMP
mmetsp:Transcript_46198/g.90219  ORF Transcript_46198/g.90219 Transcript_46198/m.90219 type:complete len:221 (-) Transcript_46198:738-1400(-)